MDGTYGQEASKQGLIMPSTFNHMNTHERNDNSSTRAKRLEQVEKDAVHLSAKTAEAICKLDAMESFFKELAMRALGDTPETSRFIDELKASYQEALLDVQNNPKAFIRS